NLILNGEITREQALAELSDPPDDPERQRADKRYVAKKLGWSEAEFERIIALPPRSHEEFGTDTLHAGIAKTIIKYGQPFAKLGRAFLRVLVLTRHYLSLLKRRTAKTIRRLSTPIRPNTLRSALDRVCV